MATFAVPVPTISAEGLESGAGDYPNRVRAHTAPAIRSEYYTFKAIAVIASIAIAALASIAAGIGLIATGLSIALGVTLIVIPIGIAVAFTVYIALLIKGGDDSTRAGY